MRSARMQDRSGKIERWPAPGICRLGRRVHAFESMSTFANASTRPRSGSSLVAGVFVNYAKTALLMAGLLALLAIGGHALGGYQGMLTFGALGLVMNFVLYWFSDRIALMAHHARELGPREVPALHAVVERLIRRAGLPMPRLYVIPSPALNPFATGRDPQHAAV